MDVHHARGLHRARVDARNDVIILAVEGRSN
jgi:hypothetical protein